MLHSPELMLLLHNVDRAELYAELRDRSRGTRPGLARRAWSAAAWSAAARTAAPRTAAPRVEFAPRRLDCVAPCAA